MNDKSRKLQPASWLVSAGRTREPGDALNIPPVLASNYLLGGDKAYARNDGSPTWLALEQIVGGLEAGDSVAFSSGMAAIAAVFEQLCAGARVVLPADCYMGVAGLAEAGAARGRWRLERIAIADTEAWCEACAHADLVWLESPSNPLLAVADLATIGGAPRKPGGLLVVDNTFATPLNQQPLRLGADLSVQSATKFIGGHSDLLAGIVTTDRPELYSALRRTRGVTGATPGALEAFLAVRGARTMALRLNHAQASAMVLAKRLAAHAMVTLCRYPGLESHPTHAVAQRQLHGFGSIISFDVAGDASAADRVCAACRLIRHATSLGGVESTIERRGAHAGQEHLPPSMLRMSVGIEDVDDLWADLDSALTFAQRVR